MKNKDLPLKKGERFQVDIEGITHAGEGVGRCQGFTLFIPGTVPGDLVLAEVIELKKNYARARLLEVTEESLFRRKPKCTHFAGCGGCRLQHVEYSELLRIKKELVRDSLSRLAGLDRVNVRDVIGMAYPWHYRNKVHFQVEVRNCRYILGFYEEGSHRLADSFKESDCSGGPACLLVDMELNEVAEVIEKLMNKHGRAKIEDNKNKNFFRYVVLKKGFYTGEVMVILVTRSGKWPQERDLVAELMSLRPGLASVGRSINDGPAGVILGRENRFLAGRDYIIDRLGGLQFSISPASFYQVNPAQTLVLYRKALDYATLTGTETVLDAYGGIGTIALFLAGQARKVYGLEVVPAAVEDARRNAALNKITNAEFIVGEVEKVLPALVAKGFRSEVVILDPPRRGCGLQALEAVVEMRTPKVVYVSCDLGTLARDLAYLTGKGYLVEEVQPVDMFPWTAHVECVVCLNRKHS